MNFARTQSRKTRTIAPIPMTSMIDVVFLLLIFFLVTSNFGAQERKLAASLRTEGRADAAADLQPQIVDVRMAGAQPAFVLGERVIRTPSALTDVLKQLPKAQGVAVRVADDVPVQWAADALQAAVDAGFERRSYVPAAR